MALPGRTQAFDNNNQALDLYDINNYVMTAGSDTACFYRTGVESVDLTARKKIGWIHFPTTLQIGGVRSHQWMNGRRWSNAYTYNGPDGNPNTPDSPRMWDAWAANPNLFTQTLAQRVAGETFRIQNSLEVDETVSGLYVQGETRLLKDRLNILGGVRFERTVDEGSGPWSDPNAVCVRNANGSLARTPAGALIRKPEAGAIGSMEELRLVRRERGAEGRNVFEDYFPSLHLTYNITDNLLARGRLCLHLRPPQLRGRHRQHQYSGESGY